MKTKPIPNNPEQKPVTTDFAQYIKTQTEHGEKLDRILAILEPKPKSSGVMDVEDLRKEMASHPHQNPGLQLPDQELELPPGDLDMNIT
jgi:hypothetical protein